MRDLARSLHATGRPVPVPWRSLANYVRPRTQNLMLVIAAGGVGKSAFALEWATSLGSPALYVSLDTSLFDHGVRLLARRTGRSTDEIELGHDDAPKQWADKWAPELEDIDIPTRFCELTHTARDIHELVGAETEYWGEAPKLVVVDNLMDLIEAEEGAGEYRRVLGELKRVAKDHDTLVMVLHHLRRKPPKASKNKDDDEDDVSTHPVSLDDSMYEGDKQAQYALGLWRPQWNQLTVGVLKNRMGQARRNGALHTTLYSDLARMEIRDHTRGAA